MNAAVIQNDPGLVLVGRRVSSFDTVGSTQDEAHARALQGEPEGSIFIAESQTRGRGRHGRSWHCPPGKNILVSILLRPSIAPKDAPLLTFAAAVGICEAAAESASLRARIKWPNDITISGKKLAGILTETYTSGERIDHAVVGIGFNVNMAAADWPEDLANTATSLYAETGREHDRTAVLIRILRGVDRWYARFLRDGGPPVLAAWRGLSDTLGRNVRVVTAQGVIEGRAEDVDESGALRLRDFGGRDAVVTSGEVIHLR